jgi:excisionase family DNA binding protein
MPTPFQRPPFLTPIRRRPRPGAPWDDPTAEAHEPPAAALAVRSGQPADATAPPDAIPDTLVPGHPLPGERFLTVRAVAVLLRCSEKTVRRRLKDGRLRAVPLGGRLVRIAAAELARLEGAETTSEEAVESRAIPSVMTTSLSQR